MHTLPMYKPNSGLKECILLPPSQYSREPHLTVGNGQLRGARTALLLVFISAAREQNIIMNKRRVTEPGIQSRTSHAYCGGGWKLLVQLGQMVLFYQAK